MPRRLLGYTPRDAARTVLHEVVREQLESFLTTTARATAPDTQAAHHGSDVHRLSKITADW